MLQEECCLFHNEGHPKDDFEVADDTKERKDIQLLIGGC
jgi:hypothetical protein